MKIVVCAATEMEIPESVKKMKEIQLFVHGVGTAQASYSLGRYLATNTPDLAIQIGIAGSYDPNIKIGDVVQVVTDRFAFSGSEDKNGAILHLADLPFITDLNPFTTMEINNKINLNLTGYTEVNAVTVVTATGYQPTIDKMIKLYHPQIESMEGAAFFAAMKLNQVPCIQLRAISNKVEPRNRDHWNIPLAISALEKAIMHTLNLINKTSY